MPKTVLLPMDGSKHSIRALHYCTTKLLNLNEDKLCLIHIVEPPALPTMTWKSGLQLPAGEWSTTLQHQLKAKEQLRQKFEALAVDCHVRHYEVELVSHHRPGDGILIAASGKNADLIVIGNRGLGSIRRSLSGSVSDYVIQHADRPVTVVPPPPLGRSTITTTAAAAPPGDHSETLVA